jgi:multiple sugar transport system permease protein
VAGAERWWLFLVPSGVVVALVMVYPLTYAINLSFSNYDLGSGSHAFIGLRNYASLLTDQRFWTSFAQTLLFAVSAVGLESTLGLTIAYGLYRLTFGRRTLNLLLFLPHIITPVVAGLFLRWVFVGRWGLLSGLLISLGIFPPDWFGNPGWARLMIVLADSWQFTPFMILVLYAGLNTVDQSQIEAAQIDGIGVLGLLFRIMVPALKPLIVFVLAIRFMDAFRVFDMIYILTAGGPGTATETLTMYTYSLAFRLLEVGKASALGVLILLILSGFTGLLIAVAYRRERGAF